MHILTEKELTGDFTADKHIVYKALKEGNSWIGYDYFKNSKGFRYELQCDGQSWPIGSKVEYKKNIHFNIKTPVFAKVKLIKNGTPWRHSCGRVHTFSDIGKGVYRVEAYHKHGFGYRPWIFSNSIWVV